MSFILDALKKIEEDKRRGAAQQAPDTVVAGAPGRISRRGVLLMLGIAGASATLTAGLLVLGRRADDTASPEVAAMAAPEDIEGVTAEFESVVPEDVPESEAEPMRIAALEPQMGKPAGQSPSAPPGEVDLPRATRVEVEEPPRSAPSVADLPAQRETMGREPETTEPVVAESTATEMGAQSKEAQRVEEPGATSDTDSAAAFRLVGRESPRLYGEAPLPESSENQTVNESDVDEASLPEHFPKLVLQGTSVINGEPVAVINDQRVFEGDSVEGARVLGIEERVVELELEGVRFKIEL